MSAHPRPARFAAVLAAAAAVVIALPACGGSSSSPAYCSDRSSLEQSVSDLTDVDVRSDGVSALKSQVATVKTDTTALVSSAKSDFPTQTAAMRSSVDALDTAVKQLPSSPSATDVLGLAAEVTAVTSALKGFTDATSSKC